MEPTLPVDGAQTGPLMGMTVAVKDLFDVKGYPTLAGRRKRLTHPPAQSHAAAVQRLLDAGASLVGHTTMTQLAFSGVGQNPDFGHTISPWSPDAEPRMAGGSSRGSALAVALGHADIGLGTDTGGSCRIPAACNALYGFKPTADRVSRAGTVPLSPSLDSVGLMSAEFERGRSAMQCLIDGTDTRGLDPNRIVVPSFLLQDCEPDIIRAFDWLCEQLKAHGFDIQVRALASLETYADMLADVPLGSCEAFEYFATDNVLDADRLGLTDPAVFNRIMLGARKSKATALQRRAMLISRFERDLDGASLLFPTLRESPPPTEQAESPKGFDQINASALRNSAFVNLADGCAVTFPISLAAPLSATLAGPAHSDEALWDLTSRVLSAFRLA